MREIHLSNGMNALVDDGDFEYLNKFHWYAVKRHNTFYAMRDYYPHHGSRRKNLLMHRDILSPDSSQDVDHIDGNGLNNQRNNIRACSHRENMINRGLQSNNKSGFKGVSWSTKRGKWESRINVLGKSKYLGYFNDPVDAARAYNLASLKYHGEFSRIVDV